jgi:hypothetical protein
MGPVARGWNICTTCNNTLYIHIYNIQGVFEMPVKKSLVGDEYI